MIVAIEERKGRDSNYDEQEKWNDLLSFQAGGKDKVRLNSREET